MTKVCVGTKKTKYEMKTKINSLIIQIYEKKEILSSIFYQDIMVFNFSRTELIILNAKNIKTYKKKYSILFLKYFFSVENHVFFKFPVI